LQQFRVKSVRDEHLVAYRLSIRIDWNYDFVRGFRRAAGLDDAGFAFRRLRFRLGDYAATPAGCPTAGTNGQGTHGSRAQANGARDET
jgi:hypothetical protein